MRLVVLCLLLSGCASTITDVRIKSGDIWEHLKEQQCHEQLRNDVKEGWCKI